MFTGIVNFDFRKCEKCALFGKIHPHFQKLMFTGVVNFDFRKCEKCAFFEKSAEPSQKLMFTGIVNFDFRKCEKSAAHRIFGKNRRPFSKVNVYRHCEFRLSKMRKMRIF